MRRRNFPLQLLLTGIATSLLLLGCDGEPEATVTSILPETSSTIELSSTAVVLPQAPWFRLPEDWNQQHPILSPNAKPESHYLSLAEKEMAQHPGDGEGRAWLESIQAIDPDSDPPKWHRSDHPDSAPIVPASSHQRIEVLFEVGPLGIAEGGLIFVMPEPFWSWSEAQVVDPQGLGYTTAMPLSEGVRLAPLVDGATFLIEERALEPGERIQFILGAGPQGLRVDEFAERGSEILIAVDADGDGTRAWIEHSARLDIRGREGARIIALGPAEALPGETIEISIALVDSRGNRARWPNRAEGAKENSRHTFSLESVSGPSLEDLKLSSTIDLRAEAYAPFRFQLKAPQTEGTLRLVIRGQGALQGFDSVVNPIVLRQAGPHLVWADLHGHSGLSDGTGTPEDYFSYARDVARLDVIALTDHDHWGLRPIDDSPELAKHILRTALRFHEPGRFVTIPGYEWTSWLHGHRHVLYFNDAFEGNPNSPSSDGTKGTAPVYSSIDFATDRPDELWAALRGQPALTFAHHSAGEPIATNWFFPPDPVLEPITEITSIHGMSEALDAPLPVLGVIPGNTVRDVLLRGARLGFIGSGDSHDGHPGLARLAAAGQSGLAAIFTESLDRPSLLAALRNRSTFATNGIRPWMSVSIDQTFMGGSLVAFPDKESEHRLQIRYEATAPIERIDLIRSGRIASIEGDGSLSLELDRRIPALSPGEFHYVRVIQKGGGVAWSSPIYIDPAN